MLNPGEAQVSTRSLHCADLRWPGDGAVQRSVESAAPPGDGDQLGGSAQAEGHGAVSEMEKVMSLKNNVAQGMSCNLLDPKGQMGKRLPEAQGCLMMA